MAHLYDKGAEGVAKNREQAISWYTKSAEQGDATAQANLGAIYFRLGSEEEHKKAVEWFRKAAAKGEKAAQFNLGNALLQGKGVKKDEQQAAIWMRKAAEQGLSAAQVQLGEIYYYGLGVERDYVQAWAWFDTASTNDMNLFGTENRNITEKKLTAKQLQQAELLSQQYIEKYAPEAWARMQKLKAQSAVKTGNK
ncbi:Putative beta-lactamase hcpC precursor [Escherichia coli]|nr:Putative beta-lactamase hcpC precursor [Escherichia coli]